MTLDNGCSAPDCKLHAGQVRLTQYSLTTRFASALDETCGRGIDGVRGRRAYLQRSRFWRLRLGVEGPGLEQARPVDSSGIQYLPGWPPRDSGLGASDRDAPRLAFFLLFVLGLLRAGRLGAAAAARRRTMDRFERLKDGGAFRLLLHPRLGAVSTLVLILNLVTVAIAVSVAVLVRPVLALSLIITLALTLALTITLALTLTLTLALTLALTCLFAIGKTIAISIWVVGICSLLAFLAIAQTVAVGVGVTGISALLPFLAVGHSIAIGVRIGIPWFLVIGNTVPVTIAATATGKTGICHAAQSDEHQKGANQ